MQHCRLWRRLEEKIKVHLLKFCFLWGRRISWLPERILGSFKFPYSFEIIFWNSYLCVGTSDNRNFWFQVFLVNTRLHTSFSQVANFGHFVFTFHLLFFSNEHTDQHQVSILRRDLIHRFLQDRCIFIFTSICDAVNVLALQCTADRIAFCVGMCVLKQMRSKKRTALHGDATCLVVCGSANVCSWNVQVIEGVCVFAIGGTFSTYEEMSSESEGKDHLEALSFVSPMGGSTQNGP